MTPPATTEARDPLTGRILAAAIEIHRHLGPGLLESAYQSCLAWELTSRGSAVEQQVAVPVLYKNIRLDLGYRIDLVVESAVIVEIKSVERLHPIFDAQVLTYLKLSGLHTALILNFNVGLLKDGVKRLVL